MSATLPRGSVQSILPLSRTASPAFNVTSAPPEVMRRAEGSRRSFALPSSTRSPLTSSPPVAT